MLTPNAVKFYLGVSKRGISFVYKRETAQTVS